MKSALVGIAIGLGSLAFTAACTGSTQARVEVRNLDDITVLTPAEVAAIKATIPDAADPVRVDVGASGSEPGSVGDADVDAASEDPTADTAVPLNQDDRPAELKLFDAYAKFKSCIEDAGETIRGNLQDPNNPAYQDPAYAELIQTCAARSKILDALRETAQARDELDPDEVRRRNESFQALSECLKKKGWTIETTVDEKGLITPSRFESPDGTLDQRDLDQCLSDTGIADAIEQGD
ncbi:MAG: hypothetical protein RIS41_394 [Actinomycetota bacterium]|jgi:hypothetical protein